jgi:protocatechuate 3,4-dioxygenase beta subunit
MSRTERILIAAVAVLGVLALVAVGAVTWGLLGGAASSEPPARPVETSAPAAAPQEPLVAEAAPTPSPPVERERPRRASRGPRVIRDDDDDDEESAAVATGEGSLVGRVVDTASRPLPGATVEVRRGRSFLSDDDDERGARHAATTGADGTFRLTGIPSAENYLAIVRRAGHSVTRQRGIVVRPGEETRIADLILSRGGSVSGIVTDRDGVPLQGAKVAADNSPFTMIDVWNAKADFASSGADGRYRIEHLPAGKIKVHAIAKGFAPSSHLEVDVIDERDTDGVHFTLDRAVSIAGTVTDSSGEPIEGVKVYASASDYRDVSRSTVLTDAAGRYLLDGLSSATFYVFVDKDGYTRPDKRTVKAPAEGVDFRLEPNGSISGRVVDRASGTPLRRFVIRHGRGRDLNALGLGRHADFESPTGDFTVSDLDAGFYVLEVRAEGYAPKRTDPIELKSQAHVQGILVALDHGATIRGVVRRSPDGAAVAGAVVAPRRAREEGGVYFAELGGRPARERASARTDVSGVFVIENVGAGGYILEISHPDYAPAKVEGIEVPEGAAYDAGEVLIYRGGTVAGMVRDKTGASDPNAQVSLAGKGFDRRVRTGSDGRFEIRSIPPGDYTISVLVRGGQVDFEGLLQADDGGQRIAVSDGEVVTVNL